MGICKETLFRFWFKRRLDVFCVEDEIQLAIYIKNYPDERSVKIHYLMDCKRKIEYVVNNNYNKY